MTTKSEKKIKKQRLNDARKGFTRAKALRELANGADFNDKKYTEHANRHVRDRAWALASFFIPENEAERQELFDKLSKGTTFARTEALKARFDLVKEVAAKAA